MKNLLLIFTAVTLSGFFNPAFAEIKIGFVQVDKILKEAPQTQASNKRLEKEFKSKTESLKKMIQGIQKDEKDFAKNSLTLSDSEKDKTSRKLQQDKIDAQRTERELREDIDLRRREEINTLQAKVNETIEKLAKENKYDLIVYQGVAYASPAIDITDLVIKSLGK
jgi:outer membrane protein